MSKSFWEMARYEQIALDMADKIVRRVFKEGEKLSGRSTLAGTYNVSPETIRRAVALLQSTGIVEAMVGKGVIVRSRAFADRFLKEFESRRMIEEIQIRISQLSAERDRLNVEINEEFSKLVNYTYRAISRRNIIDEIQIPPDSWLVGKTIENSGITSLTGITIVAIERENENIFSPDVNTEILAYDLLMVIGPPESRERLWEIAEKTPDDIKNDAHKDKQEVEKRK